VIGASPHEFGAKKGQKSVDFRIFPLVLRPTSWARQPWKFRLSTLDYEQPKGMFENTKYNDLGVVIMVETVARWGHNTLLVALGLMLYVIALSLI
jgi:hypothetical protein